MRPDGMRGRDEGIEERVARRIIVALKSKPFTKQEFAKLKYRIAKEEGCKRVPRDHDIIKYLRDDEGDELLLLRSKGVRSASGIYTVAVMTKPAKCPKDSPCDYCPGGVECGTPQSYLGKEPALMRGVQLKFDPYEQVRYRLRQYEAIGHRPSKIQLIIMGGTFASTELDYQEWFVTRCIQAMNDFPRRAPTKWRYLSRVQEKNERAKFRCIGITMETRPDFANEPQVDRMIRLGCTMVEMGVQSLNNQILKGVNRGHTVEDVLRATRILRDTGLKVGYHMMPGLPGSSISQDLQDLRAIFEDERFKPDYLKIYPTLVIEGTELYKKWAKGEYRPLSCDQAADLICWAHAFFPKWVRVSRIQRDVPAGIIIDGVKKSNLREIVENRLAAEGRSCKCIRCREIGLASRRGKDLLGMNPKLTTTKYSAGGGTEIFMAVEDERLDVLIGFLRLRIPSSDAHRKEVAGNAIVRELHVYGMQIPVGERHSMAFQHRGWGTLLLQSAERMALEEYGLKKIVVLPGVGVRGYYRLRGYRRLPNSPFMRKEL